MQHDEYEESYPEYVCSIAFDTRRFGDEILEVTYEPIGENRVEEKVVRQTFEELVHDLHNVLNDELITNMEHRLITKGWYSSVLLTCQGVSKDRRTIVTIRREK